MSPQATVTLSVTNSLIGYIIGAFADSMVADKWGCELSLEISVVVFLIGTVLAALEHERTELIVFRFISGLGIGAEIAAVTTYIGELSPARPAWSLHELGHDLCLRRLRRGAVHGPSARAHVRLWLARAVRDRSARRCHDPVHAPWTAAVTTVAGSQGQDG